MRNVHPTIAAALKPFAPANTLPINYGGVPLEVEYDYSPSERASYDVESPTVGPGCSASVDVTGVYHEGVDILELLSEGVVAHLSDLVLDKMED